MRNHTAVEFQHELGCLALGFLQVDRSSKCHGAEQDHKQKGSKSVFHKLIVLDMLVIIVPDGCKYTLFPLYVISEGRIILQNLQELSANVSIMFAKHKKIGPQCEI
jgi:hypothetical protein